MQTKGKLVRWTHDDGTVFYTREALEAFREPRNLRGEIDRQYYEQLADVVEHWGQECVLVEVFREDNPPTYWVRFADGTELGAILGDVVFD